MRPSLTFAAIVALVALTLAACVPLPESELPATGGASRAAPLSPWEVFARIAPSVAFIETPGGAGSGFLIGDGYLLTNAHIVYPYGAVRVVFPDGSEFPDAPVLNWDLMADIAVVGPLATELSPLPLAADDRLPMGSETYLIGYPEEVELYPQPAITRGVLSRRREWEPIGFTYLQSDALILGGQSGGVLVSAQGEVLGMSGLGWPSVSQFALAASVIDIMPRVADLLAGEHPDGLGPRGPSEAAPQTRAEARLAHRYDTQTFELLGGIGDDVTLVLSGADSFMAVLFGFAGDMYEAGDSSGGSPLTWQVQWDAEGPYLLSVSARDTTPVTVTVVSTAPMRPFPDPDDGRVVAPGQTVAGSIDHPLDSDAYQIHLAAGQSIEARVDSLAFDPALIIDYPTAPAGATEGLAFDSDSGGGLYNDAAQLVYRAPDDGLYLIVVRKEGGSFMLDPDTGGYILTVKDVTAERGAPAAARPTPAPVSPPAQPEAETNTYLDARQRFEFQLPPGWEERPAAEYPAALLIEPGGAVIRIGTVDVTALGLGALTLGDYTNLVIADYRARQRDFQLETRWRLQTDAGQFAEVLVFSDLGGQRKSSEFIFAADGLEAHHIRFSAAPQRHHELAPEIGRALKTFVFRPQDD